MDQRVEKLEAEVTALSGGQQQILEKITEPFDKLNSQPSIPVANLDRIEAEHSTALCTRQGERSANTNEVRHNGPQQFCQPRLIKLEFPCFHGEEDTTSWLCRVEQFLNFHHTLEGERVALAYFHLDEDAQLWYQTLKQEKGKLQWQDFSDGLHAQFGPTQFQDFFGDLTKLLQVGSVHNYQTQFEKLLSKADVLAGHPTSLTSAIGLARLYKARNTSQRHFTTGGEEEVKAVLEISLHSIAGTSAVETIQVQGKLGHTSTIVLVDSGSTHNFMSEKLAQKVGLQPKIGEHFKVMVAGCIRGEVIKSGIVYSSQLNLTKCATLCRSLFTSFGRVVLQGLSAPKNTVTEHLRFSEIRKYKRGVLFKLFTLGTPHPKKVSNIYKVLELDRLLNEFQDVFYEPKGLSPLRVHDHKIPLQPEAQLVCVKPYRYPHYHKAEMEAKVEAVEKQILVRDQLIKELRDIIKETQLRMKKVYDRHHREREFAEEDWVYRRLQPYRQASLAIRKNFKLSPKFYGPFQILNKIGALSYKLALPKESRIHSVFHVSMLKKMIGEKISVTSKLPLTKDKDGSLYPQPQAVLDCRIRRQKIAVLIHWHGLSPAQAT
ncbi:hypothetical protein JRO89_XS02G0152200 [Xanthoceras sorbifolium]|uniref:Ty3 transposon capsid-like protein domain-containing protein n=1 Tax=Xanthoceras sorbifolium TaxID=99658 RepID=A0ABQ8IGM3_9ROSI|nr:hypothetical protein JRO89_XS02G0152200 [Xanthoceras sorbifolium]